MRETIACIVDLLNRGRDLVLATVVQKKGSAPRGVGSKMVLQKGRIAAGSVGGGPLEADIIKKAGELFGLDGGVLVDFMLTNVDASKDGMVCGGQVMLFMESLPATPANLELYSQILQCLDAGETGWLGAWLSGDAAPLQTVGRAFRLEKQIRDEDDPAGFELPVELWQKARKTRKPQFAQSGRGEAYWLERVAPQSCLYLFGGGHVGRAVGSLAKGCGFKVVVIDDRQEFANPEVHPDADETRVISDYGRAVNLEEMNPQSYIAIMTRGHLHDYEVLAAALRSRAAYIGLMGSKKKITAISARLVKDGFAPGVLDRVCTPIGLDIGAQTPVELAVAIVGELIAARSGR